MVSPYVPPGMGWIPDLPDPRDYTIEHAAVRHLLEAVRQAGDQSPVDSEVDLTEYMTPVENQGSLRASTAFAVLSVVEYFERRCYGRAVRPSKLFLYQMALKLHTWGHDVGMDFRTTFKALRRFGAPPDRFWPYSESRFSHDPSDGLLFSFLGEYGAIRYARLDRELFSDGRLRERDWSETLEQIKRLLRLGIPVVFGFSVPSLVSQDPTIQYRALDVAEPDPLGGQALVAVGYRERPAKPRRARKQVKLEESALRIRPSWGTAWGSDGYGWLPFQYFNRGHVSDCWVLLRADWVEKLGRQGSD